MGPEVQLRLLVGSPPLEQLVRNATVSRTQGGFELVCSAVRGVVLAPECIRGVERNLGNIFLKTVDKPCFRVTYE